MNNKKTRALTLLLIFAFAISLFALPYAGAQTGNKTTYPFIGAVPNPVGVGQDVLLHIGITDPTASVEVGWTGLTVTVTKPDGTTDTLGPFKTDSTGGTGTTFRPSTVGNYTLKTNFPEQTNLVATMFIPAGTVMKASTSEELTLIVQEAPIQYYPAEALPTEYWTRPINQQLREWSSVAGNWLALEDSIAQTMVVDRYAKYTDGPESAHILWAKPLSQGGLVGGETNKGYFPGDAYQGKFGGSIIMNGVLYYNRFNIGFTNSMTQQGIFAVDLRTGKELWFRNNTRIRFGQLLEFDSFNGQGAFAYVWEAVSGSIFGPPVPIRWNAYDAFTGEWVYSYTNVPSGRTSYGPNGEILIYTVDTANGWMAMWNSTRAVTSFGFFTGSWAPEGQVFDATVGYQWNKTIPAGLPGTVNAILSDRIIGSNVPAWTGLANNPLTIWALNLKPGQEGQQLFKTTWTPPAGNLTMLPVGARLEDGVFVITAKEERALYGFDVNTGQNIWGPTETQPYQDIYTLGEERAIARGVVIADGKIFSVGVAGILYCFDAKTGETLWKYTAVDKYSEILWSNNWWLNIAFIAEGKIYLVHDEHSGNQPLPRGAPTICLDIETGEEVWKIDGAFRGTQWGGTGIIGDGIMATQDSYDQRIYAIGKGPSKTTVEAPMTAVTLGSSLVIRGSVLDVSPGTMSDELSLRFPNGVPAISDDNMSEWMKYVYMQFSRPADASGVEVTLYVLDANDNYREIGKTTSNSDGFYSLQWMPDITGKYTVTASFAGSKSFWPSHAVTSFAVDPAPEETPPAEIPPDQSGTYIAWATIAIIVTIIVAMAVAVLILRKR